MSDREFSIGGFNVGPGNAPFVIAELSGNHNGSLERAMAILEAVAGAGAHAVKLQTYTADTMTIDIREGDFYIDDPESLWHGHSLYELYEKAHTPWEWHEPLFARARELGLIAFSTPFDAGAVELLETLNSPCYKIASFENTDIPLIRKVAATGKPLILSTGMATVAEIDESVRAARDAGCENLVLLQCTSMYPARAEHANLRTIPHMRKTFDCQVGLSDHTNGIGVAVAAVAFGATVIEKHVTLKRDDGGVDSAFSLEPIELAALAVETDRARRALGEVCYGADGSEGTSIRHRRSLYVVEDLKAGERLTTHNVRAIRPGGGLPPRYLEHLVGLRVRRDVKRGEPLRWDLLD